MSNKKIEKEIDKKEKERLYAFKQRDAKKYYLLTSELGLKPEDKYLYEQGESDGIN